MPGLADLTEISEVHLLIGVVGGTRKWSNDGDDVIFGTGLAAAVGFTAALISFFDI